MKTNHPYLHEEEVEPEGTGYTFWALKINSEVPVNMTSEEVFRMVQGTGVTFDFDAPTKTLTVNATVKPPKPNKPIDAAVYTIEAADADKWLVINQNCLITVPKGLAVHHIFEGEANTGVTATFQAETDAVLRHVASISKKLSANAPFGIRVKALNDYTIYGTDPINYNA